MRIVFACVYASVIYAIYTYINNNLSDVINQVILR